MSVDCAWSCLLGQRLRGREGVTEEEGEAQCSPYLYDRPGPCGSAVVVVDIVGSSLSVLPLLPARGQTLRGKGVGCG